MRIGMLLFVIMWLAGLTLRIIWTPSASQPVDPVTIPASRQIRIRREVRWLFGYRPTDGPVSVAGFVLQLPAFLSLATSFILNLVWPPTTNQLWPMTTYTITGYIIPYVVLAISIPLSIRLADHIWRKQLYL